jgi:hypothetical protein
MNLNRLAQKELIKRAKKTLDSMSFFGIYEFQNYSDMLFERSFGNGSVLKFKNYSSNDEYWMKKSFAYRFAEGLNVSLIDRIKEINSLDIELYDYAVTIFFKKLKYFAII